MTTKTTAAITYTASGGLIICGLTLSDVGVLVGIVVALLSFFMNWYYQAKRTAILDEAADEPEKKKGCLALFKTSDDQEKL